MNFFVVQKSMRFRVVRKDGQEFAYIFRSKPIAKVIREEFSTRGGAETFAQLLDKYRPTQHPRDIPGRTMFEVVAASDLVSAP